MPHEAVLLEQIVKQAANTYALQVLDIHAYRLGATPAVTPRHFRRDALVARNNPVDELAPCVAVNDAHVLGQRITLCLSRLRHEIRDQNPRRGGILDRFGNARNQKIRQNACVQRTGAD